MPSIFSTEVSIVEGVNQRDKAKKKETMVWGEVRGLYERNGVTCRFGVDFIGWWGPLLFCFVLMSITE